MWAALLVLIDQTRCCPPVWSNRDSLQPKINNAPISYVNPVERKVARMLRKPYEQPLTGMLAATNHLTQTSSDQVGSTHRQVQTLVTVGSKVDHIL